jgi:hypothetical protein
VLVINKSDISSDYWAYFNWGTYIRGAYTRGGGLYSGGAYSRRFTVSAKQAQYPFFLKFY